MSSTKDEIKALGIIKQQSYDKFKHRLSQVLGGYGYNSQIKIIKHFGFSRHDLPRIIRSRGVK